MDLEKMLYDVVDEALAVELDTPISMIARGKFVALAAEKAAEVIEREVGQYVEFLHKRPPKLALVDYLDATLPGWERIPLSILDEALGEMQERGWFHMLVEASDDDPSDAKVLTTSGEYAWVIF